jgi:hypothetical protein
MPFKPGFSGNINGRPVGVKNKTHIKLRELISDFLQQRFEDLVNDFSTLEIKDKFKIFIDLLQYSLPRLQATTISTDLQSELESLSDEGLEALANRILELENSQQ